MAEARRTRRPTIAFAASNWLSEDDVKRHRQALVDEGFNPLDASSSVCSVPSTIQGVVEASLAVVVFNREEMNGRRSTRPLGGTLAAIGAAAMFEPPVPVFLMANPDQQRDIEWLAKQEQPAPRVVIGDDFAVISAIMAQRTV